jgi:RNA polymerase sigma-70 factor (ECF subfamily)
MKRKKGQTTKEVEISDDTLVERAQEDARQYELLYTKYTKKIYTYFWFRVGRNREVAEDLTQDTFFHAFRSLDRFKTQGYSYFSYLLRIAHNLLVNYYRKPKTIALPEPDSMPAEYTEDARDVERKSDSLIIWKAMKDLPINEQNALILFYWDDLSVREIAAIMDKSENAVKLLLSRGRKRLGTHEILAEIGGLPPKLREDSESSSSPTPRA